MPNKKFHVVSSVVTSVAGNLAFQSPKEGQDLLSLIIGSAIGGCAGARLPDIIDPADSPRHRGVGHGIGTAVPVLIKMWGNSTALENLIFKVANEVAEKAKATVDTFLKPIFELIAFICHCLVWAVKGFIIGYGTHLAFDSTTKMSLPVCCSKF